MKNIKHSNWKNKNELRFIVTQNCNFKCTFCHHEGVTQICKNKNFNTSDYVFMFNTCRKHLNWDSVTLTGGEPFIKSDIDEIIKALSNESAHITVVSNGSLLDKHTDIGKYLQRVNVSIHSLEEEVLSEIIGVPNMLEKQLRGLHEFRKHNPNTEIRINTTLGDYNFKDESFLKLTKLAEDINASIKYIELYPDTTKGFVPISAFEEKLVKYDYKKILDTSRKVIYSNNKVEIGLTRIPTEIGNNEKKMIDYLNSTVIFVSQDGQAYLFTKENKKIDIFDEVKNRDEQKLISKINQLIPIIKEYYLEEKII